MRLRRFLILFLAAVCLLTAQTPKKKSRSRASAKAAEQPAETGAAEEE